MGSLNDDTEAALAGVLALCRATQEDVEAVQRHDEAAIALLDINDDEAIKVPRKLFFPCCGIRGFTCARKC